MSNSADNPYKEPRERICEFCKMIFKARTSLYKHMVKRHPEDWNLKQQQKRMERQFQCQFCHRKFRYKNNLSSHMKKVHLTEMDLTSNQDGCSKRKSHLNYCKELGCQASFSTVELLKQHLTNEHFIVMETVHLTFKTFYDFEEWRKSIERNTTRFMPRMKWPRLDGSYSRLYKCMRSGVYAPTVAEENRKRRLKSEGSYKIGQHCPAQMTVISYPSGLTKVKACLTHYGHEFNGKYTYGYNKNKNSRKKKGECLDEEHMVEDYIVKYSEGEGHLKMEENCEVLTSSLASRENLRDQAKELCGFLQGLLTTSEVGEENLSQIIMNLNASVTLAGWKPVQESEFVPVDVVHSVNEIETQVEEEEEEEEEEVVTPVHRIMTDTSNYVTSRDTKYDPSSMIKPKMEQQEVVHEYLITDSPCEQYILWA